MSTDKNIISWDDFKKVQIRKGTILRAENFPEAYHPAYKVWVDFGPELGILKTSARITEHYKTDDLPGMAILGITNLPKKQIGKFMSEFLLSGFEDDNNAIILATCDPRVPDGALLK